MARNWWLYPLVGGVVWMLTALGPSPAPVAVDWPGVAAAARGAGLSRTAASIEQELAPSFERLAAHLTPAWPLLLGGALGVTALAHEGLTTAARERRSRPAAR